ncbi:MAG TPA: 50S ribosomal protein L32 [Thermodesulfovibrionales bacterium]|nr:50S ribosomal protein L32 [Thermodesulfovibrionales bacterium]
MANPTHRHSRARRDKRRANWKGQSPNLGQCPECKELKLPHRACPSCGSYNGTKVLEIVEK